MVFEVLLGVLPPPPYGPPGVLLPGLVTETVTAPAFGDVCSCDRGGELLRRDVGCSSLRTVPVHHRVVVETAAVQFEHP